MFLNDQPDGVNINENCGSTHIEQLADFVKKLKYYGGVAFDGDADRCLAVDEQGNLIDGDKIIAALAMDMKAEGELDGNAAVVTRHVQPGLFPASVSRTASPRSPPRWGIAMCSRKW